jgi:hypothetical protein
MAASMSVVVRMQRGVILRATAGATYADAPASSSCMRRRNTASPWGEWLCRPERNSCEKRNASCDRPVVARSCAAMAWHCAGSSVCRYARSRCCSSSSSTAKYEAAAELLATSSAYLRRGEMKTSAQLGCESCSWHCLCIC